MKPSRYILPHAPAALEAARQRVAARGRPAGGRTFVAASQRAEGLTIGLWDLGAWLGGLSRLVEALNGAQKALSFFELKATVPAGLISRPERVTSWLARALGRGLEASEVQEIQDNLIANDYFELADSIRRDFELNYVVGITPSMVAGENDEEIYYNHFSTFSDRAILVSTYDLRRFAAQTGRPFEAFLAGIIVAQVLVAQFYPRLGFHEDRGCLFDYNADRESLMEKVHDLQIEPECMNAIAEPYRPATRALVQFLREFGKE